MQWVSCCERLGRKRGILAAPILRRVKKCRFPGQSPAGISAPHAVIVCEWTKCRRRDAWHAHITSSMGRASWSVMGYFEKE